MRTLIAALAFSMAVAGPVRADLVGDYAAAARQGFEPVEWVAGTDEMAGMVDRQLVSPWMNEKAPGAAYSFSYAVADLNGDGFGDVVVQIQTPALSRLLSRSQEGMPVPVGYRAGASYLLVEESWGLDVVTRSSADGGMQVGFLDRDGDGFRMMGD